MRKVFPIVPPITADKGSIQSEGNLVPVQPNIHMPSQNRTFGAWNVRWVWKVGNPSWVLHKIDTDFFASLIGQTDVYWSQARYAEDALDLPKDEVEFSDCVRSLYIDFDAHGHLVTTFNLVQPICRLIDWLAMMLGVSPDVVTIWSSGRGFHVVVPAEYLQRSPGLNINEDYRELTTYLRRQLDLFMEFVDTSKDQNPITRVDLIDLGIYGAKHLIRVPGTLNSRVKIQAARAKFRIPTRTFMAFKTPDPIGFQEIMLKASQGADRLSGWWL